MKVFRKTIENSTVLGVFRVDQAQYGIITIVKKFLCVLFETSKKITVGLNKQWLSMLPYKQWHTFGLFTCYCGLVSFLFERDEVRSFLHLVEVREDFLLLRGSRWSTHTFFVSYRKKGHTMAERINNWKTLFVIIVAKKNDDVSTTIFVLWIVGKACMKFSVIKSV